VKSSVTGAFVAALFVALLLPGCFSDDPVEMEAQPAVEKREGMSYYVGGPTFLPDRYGRLRIARFNGPVLDPVNRGLMVGVERRDDDSFEYRTWIDGKMVARSSGFFDEGGFMWFTERERFSPEGIRMNKQVLTYDDELQVMHSHADHFDEEGAVTNTLDMDTPYTPEPDDFDDDDSSEE
jgi:hypothetical protein